MKKIIVRKYLIRNIFFFKNIVLEGIFDNIDFKGESSTNNNVTNPKPQNTTNNEIRKNSSNSNVFEGLSPIGIGKKQEMFEDTNESIKDYDFISYL